MSDLTSIPAALGGTQALPFLAVDIYRAVATFPLDYARALLSDYRMGIRRTVNNLALTYMPGADTTLQPRAMALFQAVVAGYLVVLSRSPRDLHANSDYNKGQSTLNDPPKPEGTL